MKIIIIGDGKVRPCVLETGDYIKGLSNGF